MEEYIRNKPGSNEYVGRQEMVLKKAQIQMYPAEKTILKTVQSPCKRMLLGYIFCADNKPGEI